MFTSWIKRKARLGTLLQSNGDEDEDGLALDRILHGQSVIAKTAKTIEVDKLRFTDKDLALVGTLEFGQFSVIDVVSCNINGRVYVRKSIEKRFAFKTREQCNPQLEREILLRALRTDSVWAPHLLCAFQTGTHLNLVMDYLEGGTLWDVLESNPLQRVPEADLRWWLPQVISAIAWCHSQGFVHRDVKPHNFVLNRTAHVQLIDFGSAASLVPGSRVVPLEYCRVPCGTCDYISPEILQAHEVALVAMEMSDEESDGREDTGQGSYGVETDWWSTGAMIYEMVHGVAPFFARDIRSTYLKIVDFKESLTFHTNVFVSTELRDLLTRLLTDAKVRLGRNGTNEVTQHPFFDGTTWETLHSERQPPSLHLPLFSYNEDLSGKLRSRVPEPTEDTSSTPFAFSAFFQPSEGSNSPGPSVVHTTSRSILREQAEPFFIGFSWGPMADAFTGAPMTPVTPASVHAHSTSDRTFAATTTELVTPVRRIASISYTSALQRTRTAPRRAVSDREAMRQLVDCIGLSARKKVLAAGRTPRSALAAATSKTLRFATYLPAPPDFANAMNCDGDSASIGNNGDSSNAEDMMFTSRAAGEDDSDGTSASDAPPSPSPSPRPGSAMSMLERRSATPTALLPHPPLPVTYSSPDGEDDVLGALEERHRTLMGEIASIEGRMGAVKRQTR